MTTLTSRITYAEFRTMEFADDDTAHYELINGDLVRKAAPSPEHQLILRNLAFEMHQFVRERNFGTVLFAPIDVFLDDYNAPQPDLLFISESKKSIITKDGIIGVPDIVVEIISPSSVVRDRIEKLGLYERFAVPEYWLVDAQNKSVEIYQHTSNGYEVFSAATVEENVKSKILDGFSMELKTLFG
jgi:Uma2 family endonuclease